uniref:Fe2OG dioxygenase domain-containing protein n=1 Tax=Pyramimonas obovata TaxID=1411642 RepID=A0A6T7URF2_9CHLO|mmetsp:Transcript_13991/g.29898  ORF Transcript_13991/g.29898 Transcript_13991/m.29898 type:complete len:320 (+) Transcript_13991:405-1364(+)
MQSWFRMFNIFFLLWYVRGAVASPGFGIGSHVSTLDKHGSLDNGIHQTSGGLHSNTTKLLPRKKCNGAEITHRHVMYTVRRIHTAIMFSDPFPHLYIKNIFHPKVYACMIGAIPKTLRGYEPLMKKLPRYWMNLMDEKGSVERRLFSSGSLDFGSQFWNSFAKHFGSALLKKTYMNKFNLTVSLRSPESTKHVFWTMALSRDLPGIEVGPHTDVDNKLVTVLYYLPKDTQVTRSLGTLMLRSKNKRIQPQGSKWESWKDPDFEVVKRADFVPNSVFAFAPCHSSWHAVPKFSGRHARDTIQAFINSPDRLNPRKAPCAP